jgi:hypothetical protein
MRLTAATDFPGAPISLCPTRGDGDSWVINLRLNRTEHDRTLPARSAQGHDTPIVLHPAPAHRHDRAIADAQSTLDRIQRQMDNLRDLLGESFHGPDGPRAA